MNYSLLFAYISTIALLIATPGPVLAYVLFISGRYGVKTAIITTIATNIASLTLLMVAALVLVGALIIHPLVFEVISIIGCVALFFIAIKMIKQSRYAPQAPSGEHGLDLQQPKKRLSQILLQGYLLGVANPKDVIFFVALFPQFIHITSSIEFSLAILTLGWIVCDFGILLAYILIINKTMRHRMQIITKLAAYMIFIVACLAVFYNIQKWF
ncbi:LysE family translocator [Pelistega suis]|uniref:LysE family translocator n=1 Tax=Pelistega suis TaxID=1631957 RepID=UPI00211CEE58|nr:LysE family translocator [Pelistega suis]MCQ9327841.1 LysE family translocator [Pelistega suis]